AGEIAARRDFQPQEVEAVQTPTSHAYVLERAQDGRCRQEGHTKTAVESPNKPGASSETSPPFPIAPIVIAVGCVGCCDATRHGSESQTDSIVKACCYVRVDSDKNTALCGPHLTNGLCGALVVSPFSLS